MYAPLLKQLPRIVEFLPSSASQGGFINAVVAQVVLPMCNFVSKARDAFPPHTIPPSLRLSLLSFVARHTLSARAPVTPQTWFDPLVVSVDHMLLCGNTDQDELVCAMKCLVHMAVSSLKMGQSLLN